MKSKTAENKNQVLVAGLEFIRLTHWDRYILNENIAILESKLFPEDAPGPLGRNDDQLWRGNRRRHYRLDTHSADLYVNVDFRPAKLKCYSAKLLDISPTGCCILLPPGEIVEVNNRIPRLQISFGKDSVVCRARIIYLTHDHPFEIS